MGLFSSVWKYISRSMKTLSFFACCVNTNFQMYPETTTKKYIYIKVRQTMDSCFVCLFVLLRDFVCERRNKVVSSCHK